MHRYLSLLLFIGLAWGQKEYNINHIVEQDSVYKKKFSDEIVNGNVYVMFDDMKVPLGKMKNGEKEGIWTDWYSSGTIKSKTSWKNGNISGTCYYYRILNGTIEFRTENTNSNDYTKFFYDNSGNISKYSMEYQSGEMYQGSELKFYKNLGYIKDLYLYNYALDPKVLYYDKGELTKTEYISRETGEVIKVTRIWRMKRHMKRIFLNIASFYSNTPNLQRGVGEIKK
jgi:antitoxin component YwqK of YwqJK toxin-antitoxin module